MKLRNLLLVGATLPLLGACVYAGDPGYGYGGGAYYGDAYPTSGYIEYNNSYGHRGYRENYWAHDRAREENFHRAHGGEQSHAAVHEEHGGGGHEGGGHEGGGHEGGGHH
jgi:hypothetical protein